MVPEKNFTSMNRLYLTPEDVAELFQIQPRTVLRATLAKEITSVKIGRAVRTTPEDICFSHFVKINPDSVEARIEFCKEVYEAHLRLHPERREIYEKDIKLTFHKYLSNI